MAVMKDTVRSCPRQRHNRRARQRSPQVADLIKQALTKAGWAQGLAQYVPTTTRLGFDLFRDRGGARWRPTLRLMLAAVSRRAIGALPELLADAAGTGASLTCCTLRACACGKHDCLHMFEGAARGDST